MVPVDPPAAVLPFGAVIQLVPIKTAPPANTMHIVTTNLRRIALL